MIGKDSISSHSSLPQMLREDDEDSVEILIFDPDSPELDADYDVDEGLHDDLPGGYTLSELENIVTFVKSSKNPQTGMFDCERKTVLWCIQNGCEEVQPGLWAKLWYFTYLHGELEGKRAWIETMSKRLVKESGGRAIQVHPEDYDEMLYYKEKGNRAFARGQYKTALDCYINAENLMGGYVSGMYLVPYQRTEMVNLLSNQAECYLRQRKYEDSILQACRALQLDKRHQKSLLRRAKATLHALEGLEPSPLNSLMTVSNAAEDLEAIIRINGAGVLDAKNLLKEIGINESSMSVCSQQ